MFGEKEKVIYSAIQPTGSLTIGNYIGAVRNFIELEKSYKCFFAVADMHSITVDILPAALRKNSLELFAMYLAFGLNPDKSTIFIQSHVRQHAELTWILNCSTQYGEAKRMTQFKDKSKKAPENINVGLFDYPVLMAADILLYNADYVPIGKDQKQHLELTRVIAERFNSKYSPTFTVPEGIFPKYGAKVFSLANPAQKMSKSDENPNGYILLSDSKDDIVRKFKRAVTDSETEIKFDPANKAGVSNLLTIYSAFKNITVQKAEKDFEGMSYAQLKEGVAQSAIETLIPLQERFNSFLSDKAELERLIKKGAQEAGIAAGKTISKVKRKVGFVQF